MARRIQDKVKVLQVVVPDTAVINTVRVTRVVVETNQSLPNRSRISIDYELGFTDTKDVYTHVAGGRLKVQGAEALDLLRTPCVPDSTVGLEAERVVTDYLLAQGVL